MADLDMTVVRMRHITDAPRVVGEALLRSFPLRLWDRQQEHTDAVLREFRLILGSATRHDTPTVPQHLLEVTDSFTLLFGTLVDAVAEQRALADGHDRIEVRVPLVERTPDLIDYAGVVLQAVDEYCADGGLLTLARPPEMIALVAWIMSELSGQYYGAAPCPWSGPF